MVRFGHFAAARLGSITLILAAALLAPAVQTRQVAAAADPPAVGERIGEHLQAGEFAPALALAKQSADPHDRDQLLGQIARAQAQAGARQAAAYSLLHVGDSAARGAMARDLNASGSAQPAGAFGGQEADFEALIELIVTTVAPTSWDEVGGPGSIKEFEGGVYIDALGVVRRALERPTTTLASLRTIAAEQTDSRNVRRTSELRKISLPRLERVLEMQRALGKGPTDEMRALAGLERIKYVLVYPGEVVLAGPADDWERRTEGRLITRNSHRPVVQLDDLIVLLRQMFGQQGAFLSCSITPRQEALARTRAFLERTSSSPIKPAQRERWLAELRNQLGLQDVKFKGIDPRTRVAEVLLEADYRMKLVGMGLEPGTLGVDSYLSLISAPKGGDPPPMEVLRWWFTLRYDALRANPERNVFELRGQGVQVLSENELLTRLGERVHTGASKPLNDQFASSFTRHFAELAAKYPIYAELQNIFDLALVAALIKTEDLPGRSEWRPGLLLDSAAYQVATGSAPKAVETVINHRVIGGRHIVAGISGGVRVDPWKWVQGSAVKTDTYGDLPAEHIRSAPKQLAPDRWWWD